MPASLPRIPPLVAGFHLLITVLLLLAWATGFRIAADSSDSMLLRAVAEFALQGNVYHWHLLASWALMGSILGYLLYFVRSERWRTLWRQTQSARVVIIWFGIVLLVVALLSGLSLFWHWPILDHKTRGLVHQGAAWGLLLFFVAHLVSVTARYGVLGATWIFVPGKRLARVSAYVAILSASITAAVFGFQKLTDKELVLGLADRPVVLDGRGSDPLWRTARPITINTYNGANQLDGEVPVTVRALHDGKHAYFSFRWPDSTRSLSHLPLLKTEGGWKVLHTAAGHADENLFYEDKFAVMLSRSSVIGAGSAHLGPKPLSDHPPSLGGRGLHYTADGGLIDLWHWKAVRTGLSLGQMDNNFVGAPIPTEAEYDRFTAGYQQDPTDCEHLLRWDGRDYQRWPECGGYLMNWDMSRDRERVFNGYIQPFRLPRDPNFMDRMGDVNLDPQKSDSGQWWMSWEDTVAYSIERDRFPVGTVIPSVIALGPFQQGRGGIDAVAQWHDGFWTLEVRRLLQVDSPYSLSIEDGLYLWVAAFNHSQTRHSIQYRPVMLRLEAR